ncbi:DUF6152 family protein [Streptomyces sp. CAI-155]|uniref:DUF6152 family protein n=1 Tax=Streptomyces sp. CAI-155 TaxID=1472660 RepID=UPI0020CA2DB4|nr:DUF6152 family protein [Streptomyces sp. CAI-155]
MRPFTTAIPLARHRRTRLATASLLSATLLLAFSAGTAQAHHGFDDFDTDRLYYIAGTVSQVRWGEPHSYFTVTVENDLPDDTPEHDLPDGLRDPADSDPINAAPFYGGSHDDLAVTIAPPSFTLMWGLDRELDDGERVEAGPTIWRGAPIRRAATRCTCICWPPACRGGTAPPTASLTGVAELAFLIGGLANDLLGHAAEQQQGDPVNAVTVLAHEYGLPLPEAYRATVVLHAAHQHRFDALCAGLLADTALSGPQHRFVRAVMGWVAGSAAAVEPYWHHLLATRPNRGTG